jgi:hypothetical protein
LAPRSAPACLQHSCSWSASRSPPDSHIARWRPTMLPGPARTVTADRPETASCSTMEPYHRGALPVADPAVEAESDGEATQTQTRPALRPAWLLRWHQGAGLQHPQARPRPGQEVTSEPQQRRDSECDETVRRSPERYRCDLARLP